MTYENEKGQIFNDDGKLIWPSCHDKFPDLEEFMLNERREHPEKQCVNGGRYHRMIQTINYNNIEKKSRMWK